MARRSKIIQYGLESIVVHGRAEALTLEQIQDRINQALKRRGINDSVSRAALSHYISTLNASAIPELHRPQIVEEQLGVVVNVGERVKQSLERLDQFLAFAETERDQRGERQYGPIVALTGEIRMQTRLYVDVLDKLYSAQRVAIFQQAVLDAIDEADPETAERVRANMRRHHEIRRAALLGA